MSNDLVKQLRNRADRWMKYDYEEHAKTDTEAADRIEELQKQLAASDKQIKKLEDEIENLEYEMCEMENRS